MVASDSLVTRAPQGGSKIAAKLQVVFESGDAPGAHHAGLLAAMADVDRDVGGKHRTRLPERQCANNPDNNETADERRQTPMTNGQDQGGTHKSLVTGHRALVTVEIPDRGYDTRTRVEFVRPTGRC